MKEILEFILTSICDFPEKIEISESEQNGLVTFSLKLDRGDIGKVIGKQGKIIKALRTLLRIKAFKEGKKVEIVLAEETPA